HVLRTLHADLRILEPYCRAGGPTRGKAPSDKGCASSAIIRRMIHAAPDDIKGRSSSGSSGCKRNLPALPWRANAVYAAAISSSFAPAPPRMSERFGAAPLGKYNGNPTLRNFAANRFGP